MIKIGTIKTGSIIESDDLLNNMIGKQFKNYAQTIFNADYIGWNSKLDWNAYNTGGEPEFTNLKYDTFVDTTKLHSNINEVDSAINDDTYMFYSDDFNSIFGGVIYDNYSNGSVDASKWSQGPKGTLSEVTDTYIQLDLTGDSGDNNIYLNSWNTGHTTGLDLKPAANNQAQVIFYYYIFSESSGSQTHNHRCYLIDDDSNSTTLVSDGYTASSGTTTNTVVLDFYLDGAIQFVRIWKDGELINDDNLSVLTGDKWGIRLYANTSNMEASDHLTIRMYPVVYVNNSTLTASDAVNFLSATTSESVTNILGFANTNNVDMSYTSDGTNYETMTIENEIHRFTDTGSSFIVKGTADTTSALTTLPMITEYATLYNIGAGSA